MANLEKLFDLAIHLRENEGQPFDGVDYKKLDGILRTSVQAFIHEPGQIALDRFGRMLPREQKMAIQAFSGSSDLPQLTKDVFDVTAKTPNFDLAWQQAFKGMSLRKGQLSWEIADVETGGTFELIPEGEKVKFESLSGSKATVDVKKYGYGLGVTWETMEGRKLYAFVDQMEQARAKLYTLWANVHYGLLATAAAGTAVAWQGIATDPVVDRDIATLNTGAYTIGEATKDSGYGDTANAGYLVYVSPKYRARMEAALESVQANLNNGRPAGAAGSVAGSALRWNVEVRYSFNGNIPADKAVMVLPGNKVQNAVYLRELGLSKQDIESLNELRTYWTAFGAAVGDNNQTALLSLS